MKKDNYFVHIIICELLCINILYAADTNVHVPHQKDTSLYSAMTYDDARDHDKAYALMSEDFGYKLPSTLVPVSDEKKVIASKKMHRVLRTNTPMNQYPVVENSFHNTSFYDTSKKEFAGFATYFLRKDTNMGLIDSIYIHKDHRIPLYPILIKTILHKMLDEKIETITIYERDQNTRLQDHQLEYQELINAGFTEKPDADANEVQCVMLAYSVQKIDS
jgi:hypothetical protein